MRVDTHRSSPRRSIYDGQTRLGDFQQHGTEVVARNRFGEPIGVFNTVNEAIDAIAKAAGAP